MKEKIQKELIIGYIIDPPYVFKINNKFRGICTEIWETIARNLKIKYKYINAGNDHNKAIIDLSNYKYDLILNAIQPSIGRMKNINFSQPVLFYRIIIAYSNKYDIFNIIKSVINQVTVHLITLFIICFICILIYSKIEYNSYLKIDKSILTVFFNFLIGGSPKIAQKTKGKIFIIFITLLGILYTAIMIATLSSIAMKYQKNRFKDIQNIYGKKFVVAKGTIPQNSNKFANVLINFKEINGDQENAFNYYLKNINNYDGILMPNLSLNYFGKKYKINNLVVSDFKYTSIYGVLAISNKINYELYTKINHEIIKIFNNEKIYNICKNYIHITDLCSFQNKE